MSKPPGPKEARNRELLAIKLANAARPKAVFTGITINEGVTLSADMVNEVLVAAVDNVDHWEIPAKPAKPKAVKIAEAKKAIEAVSQKPVRLTKVEAKQSNATFDRNAYQREYMRKKRAEEK